MELDNKSTLFWIGLFVSVGIILFVTVLLYLTNSLDFIINGYNSTYQEVEDEIQREMVDKLPGPVKFYLPEKVILTLIIVLVVTIIYFTYSMIAK